MSEIVNPEYPILGFLRLKAGIIGRPIRETHGTIVDRIAAASGVVRVANGFRCPDDRQFGGTFTDATGSTCGLRIARGAVDSPADIVARGLRERNTFSGTRRRVRVPDNPGFHGAPAEFSNGSRNPKHAEAENYFLRYGQKLRGVPISWRDERIPDTVFHVTTASRAVRREGMLRAGGQGGLGGDTKDRIISMTVDRAQADQIKEDMLLAFDIARAADVEEVVELIIDDARRYGVADSSSFNSWLTQEASRDFEVFSDFNRGMLLTSYLFSRERDGGPKNSYFADISNTFANLRTREREDIDVIDIPRERLDTGAMLVDFDMSRSSEGLGEVRLYGDITLNGSDDLQASVDERINRTNETVNAVLNQSGSPFADLSDADVDRINKQIQGSLNPSQFRAQTKEQRLEQTREAISRIANFIKKNPELLEEYGLSPWAASKLLNTSNEDIIREVEYQLLGLFQNLKTSELRVRMKQNNLGEFLESGLYKTVHSGGAIPSSPANLRKLYEATIGFDIDTPPELRPVSGYTFVPSTEQHEIKQATLKAGGNSQLINNRNIEIDPDAFGGLSLYGSVDFIMHDAVKGRSSVAFGDTLNYSAKPVAYDSTDRTEIINAMSALVMPYGNPDISTNVSLKEVKILAQIIESGLGSSQSPSWRWTNSPYTFINRTSPDNRASITDPYFETLISGGFDIEDIKEIRIPYANLQRSINTNERGEPLPPQEWAFEHFTRADFKRIAPELTESQIDLFMATDGSSSFRWIDSTQEMQDYALALEAQKIQTKVQSMSQITEVTFTTKDGIDPLDPLSYGLPPNSDIIEFLKERGLTAAVKRTLEDPSSLQPEAWQEMVG
jgi:ElaB/YqjD/DUF883 family membrane-anchored ribosome-binding protein